MSYFTRLTNAKILLYCAQIYHLLKEMRLIFGLAAGVFCLGLAVFTGGNLASLSLACVSCENAEVR
jgi:hypothetical protein